MSKRKIAYISGTRADFGLMTPVLREIKKSPRLTLNIYATGMHLMKEFGSTIKEVQKIFPAATRLSATIPTDTDGNARFVGALVPKIIKALIQRRPDLVLVLGDRPEMLSTAIACLYLQIPVAHIHGGEKTSTLDETARHAITKLSHLHFTATRTAAQRIKQMGEEAWRIHTVGAPGLDMITNTKLPTRQQLFKKLKLFSTQPVLLITLHPISEASRDSRKHMSTVINAVKSFNLPVVITYPNADPGGRAMIREIERYRQNKLFTLIPSLPYPFFLALEREAAVWIGNSSGAMIESSTFHTPAVNVGPRQVGREHGNNVISVPYDEVAIQRAIDRSLHDKKYINKIKKSGNPWGDGTAAKQIRLILEQTTIDQRLLFKHITYA